MNVSERHVRVTITHAHDLLYGNDLSCHGLITMTERVMSAERRMPTTEGQHRTTMTKSRTQVKSNLTMSHMRAIKKNIKNYLKKLPFIFAIE